MARIKSGTQSSRRSALSKSRKPKTYFVWNDPRYAESYPGNKLVVVSDTGANVTRLGLINTETMGKWGLLIYSAQDKNLTLGQVFELWLNGNYALKRHAQAMNLAMSREQKRELKNYLRGAVLNASQRELVEITLGGPMPKLKAEALPEVVPGPEPLIYDTFEYKVLEDCNFITCGGCATLEDKIQEQVYRDCDEPDAYAECVITVGDPWASRFGCYVCGKICDKTTANGFLIQFHGT